MCRCAHLLLERLAAGLHVPHLNVNVVLVGLLEDVDGFHDESAGLALRGRIDLIRLGLIVRLVAKDDGWHLQAYFLRQRAFQRAYDAVLTLCRQRLCRLWGPDGRSLVQQDFFLVVSG